MKRAFAAVSLAILAAPALAQQAPETAGPDLGRNYNGLPYVYDLVARPQPPQPVRVIDPEKQARVKICEERMMRELRRSGLAENGKVVYRACAEKLGVPDVAPGVQPAQ